MPDNRRPKSHLAERDARALSESEPSRPEASLLRQSRGYSGLRNSVKARLHAVRAAGAAGRSQDRAFARDRLRSLWTQPREAKVDCRGVARRLLPRARLGDRTSCE